MNSFSYTFIASIVAIANKVREGGGIVDNCRVRVHNTIRGVFFEPRQRLSGCVILEDLDCVCGERFEG
jgi:hypothetical protein